MNGVVYDTGALIAADRGDRKMANRHREFLARSRIPVVPAGVVAQAWAGVTGPLPVCKTGRLRTTFVVHGAFMRLEDRMISGPIPQSYDEVEVLMARADVSVCWACDRVERIDDSTVRVCLECGHVYAFEPATFFCDVCLHDF
jgi:hypothetical protein